MKTIYVIHRYFYESYDVLEAYSDEADAHARADYLREHDEHHGYDVEEIILDPDKRPKGTRMKLKTS